MRKPVNALFVGLTGCVQILGLEADFLLGVAVHSNHAVTAGNDVDKFVGASIANIGRIFHRTRLVLRYISIPDTKPSAFRALKSVKGKSAHANTVQTNRAVEVETAYGSISKLFELGRRGALICTPSECISIHLGE
jgi:hypothetical protein